MKWLSFAALTGAGSSAAFASILLKKAAEQSPPVMMFQVLVTGFAAIAIYGVGFLLYGLSLRTLALSTAYVTMVAVTVLLLLAYSLWHGEPVGGRQLAGALIILLGVVLIHWKSA